MSCITGKGYLEGETIRRNAVQRAAYLKKAEAVAIAIANATQLIDNYKKQRDISDETLKLSEELQNRNKTVFWPKELTFLAEFGVEDLDIEEADRYGRRYAGRLVSTVAKLYAKQIHELKCNQPRYCTSNYVKNLQGLMMARAEAVSNIRVTGRQIGFAMYMAKNDRNFDRRLKAIALGKNLLGAAASLYKAAAGGIAMAGREISRDFGGALEMFGAAEGYLNSKFGQPEFRMQAENIAEETERLRQQNNAAGIDEQNSDSTTSISNFFNGVGNTITGFFNDATNALTGGGEANASTNYSNDASQMAGLSVASEPVARMASMSPNTYNTSDMSTDSRNQGTQGRLSLARSGKKIYEATVQPAVVGNHGAHKHDVTVTVNMADFPLKYSDKWNSNREDLDDPGKGPSE